MRVGHFAVHQGITHPALVHPQRPDVVLVREGGVERPDRPRHPGAPGWHTWQLVPRHELERLYVVDTWALYAGFAVRVRALTGDGRVVASFEPAVAPPFTHQELAAAAALRQGRAVPPGFMPPNRGEPAEGYAEVEDLTLVREIEKAVT